MSGLTGFRGGIKSTISAAKANGYKKGRRDALESLIERAAFDATYGGNAKAKAALPYLHGLKEHQDND